MVDNRNITNTIRLTRAELNTLQSGSGIVPGLIYVITDEGRIAVGTAVNAYETYAKESEVGAGFTVYSQTDLNFDRNNGNFFIATIGANATVTVTNFSDGYYYFLIKNSSSVEISVTIPVGLNSGSTYYAPVSTIGIQGTTVGANERLLNLIVAGTTRVWTISEELT